MFFIINPCGGTVLPSSGTSVLVTLVSYGRDLSKNKQKSHFYSNISIYLPGRL